MRILFLDDAEERHKTMETIAKGLDQEVIYTKSAREAIEVMGMMTFDLISLDHDLAFGQYGAKPVGEEEDGRFVVGWMLLQSRPILNPLGWIHVHSWNDPASREMHKMLLAGWPRSVSRVPFSNTSMVNLILGLEKEKKENPWKT